MRFLGLLCILIGLGAVFGYPYYQQSFTNFEIGEYTIYDKATGYDDQIILLSPEDSPINIKFLAVADTVTLDGGLDTAFQVDIKDGDETLRSETIRFSGPMGVTNENTTSEVTMEVDLKNFPVKESTLFTFSFADGDVREIPLASITMTITGLVSAPSNQVPTIGYVMIGAGAVLYLLGGRRRRKKRSGNAPVGTGSKASQIGRRAAPEPPKPEKPKRKWGRGE